MKKRKYLNETNRHMEMKKKDGTSSFKNAQATGMGFFPAAKENEEENEDEEDPFNDSQLSIKDDKSVDYKSDMLIDLERNYSKYSRFNGRAMDENLEIEDTIPVLIPSLPESTNVLLFQLVLLESEAVPKDYVVGWGVFPLLNSDFGINEGKFKIPLLFGQVNPSIDKFRKIEISMQKNLDSWLANLYFEIEKVNLSDLKVEPNTDRLFYKPVGGTSPQEQQQMLKMHMNDEIEFGDAEPDSIYGGMEAADPDELENPKSDADSSDSSLADSDLDMADEAEEFAQKYAEVMYNNERTQEDINYDHYHFSVAQKYDLTTRNISYKKFKYITDEIFLDLRWRQRKTIQFQTTILLVIFLFFLRIFLHYTGQYIAL